MELLLQLGRGVESAGTRATGLSLWLQVMSKERVFSPRMRVWPRLLSRLRAGREV